MKDSFNWTTFAIMVMMLYCGFFLFIQIFMAKGQEAVDIALKADLVILNTAVAGKWLMPS